MMQAIQHQDANDIVSEGNFSFVTRHDRTGRQILWTWDKVLRSAYSVEYFWDWRRYEDFKTAAEFARKAEAE